jgi:hypothetical protein
MTEYFQIYIPLINHLVTGSAQCRSSFYFCERRVLTQNKIKNFIELTSLFHVSLKTSPKKSI